MLDDLGLGYEEDRRRAPREIRSRRKKKKKKSRAGSNFLALFVSVLLLAALGGGVYWGLGQLQDTFGTPDYETNPQAVEVMFVVESGDNCSAIAPRLFEQNVVKSTKAFLDASLANEDACKALQPGTFQLWEQMPAAAALAILGDPTKAIVNRITVHEGETVIEIFAALAEATGIPLADFQQVAKNPSALGIDASWYAREDGRPTAMSLTNYSDAWLEGFLFPDTYTLDPTMNAAAILKMMVDRFMEIAASINLKDVAAQHGLTAYEALVIASIEQVEGVSADDFAKIARVLYNRLYVEIMPLGLDSTVNYWLPLSGGEKKSSGELTYDELHNPNDPYNTHDDLGIPIGPISNPGKDALLGALNPTPGDWLYFVGVAGTTVFFHDYYEFCDGVDDAIAEGKLSPAEACQ